MCPFNESDLSFKNGYDGNLSVDDYYSSRLRKIMPYRIRKVLLIASLYDTFLLEEDGRLADMLSQTYQQRDLGYVPEIKQTANLATALETLKSEKFDLVLMILRLGEINPFEAGKEIKQIDPNLPISVLSYDTPDLLDLVKKDDGSILDRIFLWRGDGKIVTGIIQLIEDMQNATYDTEEIGVPNIIIVEDNIYFYSTYIHIIFEELWDQTNLLLTDNLTYSQRVLRQKSRPRVHLVTNFEQAVQCFEKYKNNLLGIFSDLSFPINGIIDNEAGLTFIRYVKDYNTDIPIVVESSEPDIEKLVEGLHVGFLNKKSPTLVSDFRHFLLQYFGFGDLIFSDDNQKEIARVSNLNSLLSVIDSLPSEILYAYFHDGILKRWLMARTELELARIMDSRCNLLELPPDELRLALKAILDNYQINRYKGNVVYYNRSFNLDQWHFCRLGSGSLGGKARGLAFIDKVLTMNLDPTLFPDVSISIPRTLAIGTDFFDEFMRKNNLFELIQNETSDMRIANLFLQASLPTMILGDLRDFIKQINSPLAVRSSSLLEDALYHPFAGIYMTKMLPNNDYSPDMRFNSLCNAIKLVYSSTYFRQAKSYIESINHRIEEEKMGIIIQEIVGTKKDKKFYPEISGVARSYNYYPFGLSKPEDGVVNLALGLGKTVVDGGVSLQFSPKYPKVLPQFANIRDMLNHSQKKFFAVNLQSSSIYAFTEEDQFLSTHSLAEAELDGVLEMIGSTYSAENDTLNDGIGREGPRIISFSGILKHKLIPLVNILEYLLALSQKAMGCPVEIEFALSIQSNQDKKIKFGFLQVRPMVALNEMVKVELSEENKNNAICFTNSVLGNGEITDLHYLVYVKPNKFDPSLTKVIAEEVSVMNQYVKENKSKYILIGPGRWGSSDSWLGIPVQWDYINMVKVMVEVTLPNMNVDPSQGSHFFQNITSLKIAYFTIPNNPNKGFINWKWIEEQPIIKETEHLVLVHFHDPMLIKMDGRTGQGVILKPTEGE
jgi:CheY-like chemotaxis protein